MGRPENHSGGWHIIWGCPHDAIPGRAERIELDRPITPMRLGRKRATHGLRAVAASAKPVKVETGILRGDPTVALIAETREADGIKHFVADVLTRNHLMFKVICDAGLQPRHRFG